MKTSQIIYSQTAIFLTLMMLDLVATTPEWYRARDDCEYLIEVEQNFNWLQAFDNCLRRGLHMVIIDDARKNYALVDLLLSLEEEPNRLWLGHHDEFNRNNDKNRGFYSSVTGHPIKFKNWIKNEPNNAHGNEHCISLVKDNDYRWNDANCDANSYGYICEHYHFSTLDQSYIKEINNSTDLGESLNESTG